MKIYLYFILFCLAGAGIAIGAGQAGANVGGDPKLSMEAQWTYDGTYYMGDLPDEGWEVASEKGSYSDASGGDLVTWVDYQDTNQVTQLTSYWDETIGTDFSVTHVFYMDSDGGYYDGPGYYGSVIIAPEEGVLMIAYTNGSRLAKSSKVKMTLHTGGKNVKISNLFQLSATAASELASPVFGGGGTNFPPDQITVAGQTLDASYLTYKVFPDASPEDITPQASAPMYSFAEPLPQKYHCYVTVYAEEPNPGGGRHSIVSLTKFNAGHGWWCLSSDAPTIGLYSAGISSADLDFLGDQVGYFPVSSLLSLVAVEPGILEVPGGADRIDAQHTFDVGFNGLKNGLIFTANLSSDPGFYSLSLPAHNCVTTTIQAAAAAGVTLPNDTTPQNLGIDLNAIPNP